MLSEIIGGDLDDFKEWRRENFVREVTIRHDLHAASQLFQYAQRKRWIEDNPVRDVKVPSDADSRSERVLTSAEEAIYFRTATPGTTPNDVTKLMRLHGLRPGEALALKNDDIDLDDRTLRIERSLDASGKVTPPKRPSSRRTLALSDEAYAILCRRTASGSLWVFPGKKPGRPYTYSGLVGCHDRILAKIGFGFDIYAFRHTFATEFYRYSRDIELLRKVLGHADLKTVQRYVHLSEEDLADAMRKFHRDRDERSAEVGPEVVQ